MYIWNEFQTWLHHTRLIAQVRNLVRPYGCTVIALSHDSVGVQGDDRVVGPGIVVRFPASMNHERIAEISNRITNEVKGITRVLMDIRPI